MIHEPAEKSYAAACAGDDPPRSMPTTVPMIATLRMVFDSTSVRVSRVRRAVSGLEAIVVGQSAAVRHDLRQRARGAVRLQRRRAAGRGEDDREIVVVREAAVAVDV